MDNTDNSSTNNKKKGKQISGSKFLDEFQKKCNNEETYTLDELKKLVALSFKDAVKKTNVKREPSEYNKFMSEEIKKLRQEFPDTDVKELMKKVAVKWKEHKANC